MKQFKTYLPKYEIGAHFVTAKIFQNAPFFADPACAPIFCEELEAARCKHGFHVLAFVVMPDHRHKIRQKVAYIHANPVRAGLVASPAAYPWSSAANYETGIRAGNSTPEAGEGSAGVGEGTAGVGEGTAFNHPVVHPVQITPYSEIW